MSSVFNRHCSLFIIPQPAHDFPISLYNPTMSNPYITHTQNAHGRTEELQWARLFASGDPVKGMIVVFLQKMCAAYHEFEPAYQAGGLNESALPHFRQHLANRAKVVLTAMSNNGLQDLPGYAELMSLQQATETASSLQTLAALADPIHQVNHTITDALETFNF
jgi:hypothetical protein